MNIFTAARSRSYVVRLMVATCVIVAPIRPRVSRAAEPPTSTRTLRPWTDLVVPGAVVLRGQRELVFDVARQPVDGRLEFPRLDNVVLSVKALNQDKVDSLRLSQSPKRWSIHVPPELSVPARIRLTTAEPIYLPKQPYVATASPDGDIVLDARHALVHGEKLQFEPLPHKNTVGYWVNDDDWAEWRFRLAEPGRFRVKILQGCGTNQGGSRVRLSVEPQTIEFDVIDTGHFQNFVWRDLGVLMVPDEGPKTLSLKVVRLAHQAVMDVRQIRLELLGDEPLRNNGK